MFALKFRKCYLHEVKNSLRSRTALVVKFEVSFVSRIEFTTVVRFRSQVNFSFVEFRITELYWKIVEQDKQTFVEAHFFFFFEFNSS